MDPMSHLTSQGLVAVLCILLSPVACTSQFALWDPKVDCTISLLMLSSQGMNVRCTQGLPVKSMAKRGSESKPNPSP